MGSATGAAELEKTTSKTLAKIRLMAHVADVSDERALDQGIMIQLKEPFCFNTDPGCGSKCFDTVAEAKAGTALSAVYRDE